MNQTNDQLAGVGATALVLLIPNTSLWLAPLISGQFAEFLTSLALVIGLYTFAQSVKYNAPLPWTALILSSVIYLSVDIYVAREVSAHKNISLRDLFICLIFMANWVYTLARVRLFKVLHEQYEEHLRKRAEAIPIMGGTLTPRARFILVLFLIHLVVDVAKGKSAELIIGCIEEHRSRARHIGD